MNIYNLKLHDQAVVNYGLSITRVPGGWIYDLSDANKNHRRSVFVPFDNEFIEKVESEV